MGSEMCIRDRCVCYTSGGRRSFEMSGSQPSLASRFRESNDALPIPRVEVKFSCAYQKQHCLVLPGTCCSEERITELAKRIGTCCHIGPCCHKRLQSWKAALRFGEQVQRRPHWWPCAFFMPTVNQFKWSSKVTVRVRTCPWPCVQVASQHTNCLQQQSGVPTSRISANST